MIIRKIKVTEFEYQPPINYVAGATEPDIQFELVDFTIPEGAVARAYVKRFDGSFEYTAAVISGNTITIAPTTSMFSVKGEGAIQVTITVGDEVIKNFSVPVYVHADLADDTAQEGRDVVSVFQEAERAAAQQFQEDAEQIAEEVKESIPADYTALTEEVGQLNERLVAVEHGAGLTDEIKQALLQLAEKVVYVDDDGQYYYDALENALYPPTELLSISAIYTQSKTIFTTDSLNDLKDDLTVTANYSDGTSAVITSYLLSGTLTSGTSTIIVLYGGKTTTFDVTVTAPRSLTASDIESHVGTAISIDNNGTISLSSIQDFFVVALDQSITHIRGTSIALPPSSGSQPSQDQLATKPSYIIAKDSDDFYVLNPGSQNKPAQAPTTITKLVKGQDKYTSSGAFPSYATFTPQNWAEVWKSGVWAYETDFDVEIIDGVLIITNLDTGETATITNADRIGFWGSSWMKTIWLTNIKVYDNEA
jgi:hypothetical protein